MNPLTKRQQAVLEMLRGILEQEGAPPTLRELARTMNRDPKSVAQHLDRLELKGYIRRRPGESRNIRLTEEGLALAAPRPPRGLPLVGRIAAGNPLLAEENIEDRVEMESFFGSGEDHFLLRVQGESMKDAGICDGDLVAVQKEGAVRDGGIAAVSVNGETTVKRIHRKGRFLLLSSENPAFEPLLVDGEEKEVHILGPVKGLIRRI